MIRPVADPIDADAAIDNFETWIRNQQKLDDFDHGAVFTK